MTSNLRFQPVKDFLASEQPGCEALLGEQGDTLLPVGGFLLLYGPAGSGKSTLAVDAVAHMAAGRSWLGIPVARPVRCLLIENEGSPGLFQQKLDEKLSNWDADPEWIDNVHVLSEPWGTFTFGDPEHRVALRGYCVENDIDVVVANPLLGTGGPGAGKPDETSAFVNQLKSIGLWNNLAFLLLHHDNKSGQVSGDWSRHPDTQVLVERRSDERERTRLSWAKTRWAKRSGKRNVLAWIVEHQGFTVVADDVSGTSDDELYERIDAFLVEHPVSSASRVKEGVQGTDGRIGDLLQKGAASGRYAAKKGARNGTYYGIGDAGVAGAGADPGAALDAGVAGVVAKPVVERNDPGAGMTQGSAPSPHEVRPPLRPRRDPVGVAGVDAGVGDAGVEPAGTNDAITNAVERALT